MSVVERASSSGPLQPPPPLLPSQPVEAPPPPLLPTPVQQMAAPPGMPPMHPGRKGSVSGASPGPGPHTPPAAAGSPAPTTTGAAKSSSNGNGNGANGNGNGNPVPPAWQPGSDAPASSMAPPGLAARTTNTNPPPSGAAGATNVHSPSSLLAGGSTSHSVSQSRSSSAGSSPATSLVNSPSTSYSSLLGAPGSGGGGVDGTGNASSRSPAMSSRARPLPHSASAAAQQSIIEAAQLQQQQQQLSGASLAAARNHDNLSRNLQQLALQSSKPDTSYSPGFGRRSVKIATSTFQKPSPGFRTRTLNKASEASAALFPKFHYLPSLGLGVGSNIIDNSGKATSAFIGGDQQYHFISSDSPLQHATHKLGVGPNGAQPEHPVNTAGGGRWIHPVMGHAHPGGQAVNSQGIPLISAAGGGHSPAPHASSSDDNSGPTSKSASPGSVTHSLQHPNLKRMSSGAQGGGGGYSPGSGLLPGSGPSPGVGVRRLAEQFLNSISDDSPAVRPRRIGLGKHAQQSQQPQQQQTQPQQQQSPQPGSPGASIMSSSMVTPSAHVPTLHSELNRKALAARLSGATSHEVATPAAAASGDDVVPSKDGQASSRATTSSRATPDSSLAAPTAVATTTAAAATRNASTSPAGASSTPSPSPPAAAAAAPSSASSSTSPTSPLSPASSSSEWQQLHDDIAKFSDGCAADSASQKRLREELVQRTQWSIRCVWPTAHVDLVGSVAAGVCLPRSDLDFVIRFPPSVSPPPSYSYATATQNSAQQAMQQQQQMQPQQPSQQQHAQYSSYPTAVASVDGHSPSPSSDGSPQPPVQHFAQAGQLIKLIGGRKKSKLLFRSTKIQVFKDINLIRLRDGCSGISMDLWFPVEPHMLTRSQQHTLMMHQLLSDFPRVFYPLAVVLKSFMAQNLLNSGYSGLGSYGVLLMLIRFLQWERFNAQRDGRPEETNLGKLLVSFFRLYATFDYLHKAVDVVNIPEDGGFIAKPEVLIVFPSRKPVQTGGLSSSMASGANGVAGGRKGRKKGGDDDSDDEDDAQQHHQQQRHHDESDDEAEAQHSNVGGERESASLKKKRSNATDRFTLLILDPMDTKNQIICHHKALRNMIGAFIRAIMILDPDHPAPQLMLPPTPVVVGGAQSAQADVAAGMVGGTMSASPALTAVGPGVDASKATLVPPSGGGGGAASSSSATSSAPDTPLLVPQPIASLPQFPGLSATANNTQATRFHRLIEVNAARLGPQTKPCTSAQCLNPDGTSQTMCPIQNKVCFTCGHMFVKTASGASVSAPGPGSVAGGPGVQGQGQGQPHAGGGGGRAAKHAGQASSTPGVLTHHPQSQPQQQGGGGGGRHGHGHSLSQMQMQMQQQMQQHPHQHQQHMQGQQQLAHQHRAPPMQGQHARNYIGRQPQQQQQQQQAMQQQQQQPMFNAQALLAAQQLIAAQQMASQAALSQQHAQAQAQAQAAAAAAASQQPLMYFNLQTQQLELVSGAGVANMPPAPLGFIPVMTGWAGAGAPQPATSASPMSMFGQQQPQQQQQQAQAQGGAGSTAQNQAVSMDQAAQLANLQAMMVGLQQQQAQAQAGAQMFGYPQAVSAAAAAAASQQQQLLQQYLQLHAHPLYAGAGGVGVVSNAGDMGASSYMGGPAYSPVLSYDGLSPQYTTRTLSDSMHMGGGGASSTPPSPPTRLRGSNRASPSPQMMQQQQPQQQQQQAGNAMQLMQQQQQQAMQLQAHLAAQAGQQQQQQLPLPQQQQAGSRMSSGGTNGGGGGNGGAPPKPSSRSNRNYNNFNGQQQPQQQQPSTPSPRAQGYPYSQ